MKASQLIRELQAIVAEHGDLEVGMLDAEYFDWSEIWVALERRDTPLRDGGTPADTPEHFGELFIGIKWPDAPR